ncbi:hypothetical protein [Clostridium estertheticum]|uniref:hypothetical protein n=1 Tax=Clostridium estertheticum TaxID=238834 RepID=UPI00209B4E12|nr:hypothetical protein [Clostridium estertheticum]
MIKIYAIEMPGKIEKKVMEPLPLSCCMQSSMLAGFFFKEIPGISIHLFIILFVFKNIHLPHL